MPLDEILRTMEAEAKEERERVLAEAREERERLLSSAARDVAACRERRLDLEGRRARAERARLENEARLAGLKALTEAREAVIDAAFARAEADLSGLRGTSDYLNVLRSLLAEVTPLVEAGALVVEVDPRDAELVHRVAAAEGLEVRVECSLCSAGGLVARDPTSAILVHNTVEARLRRAREALRLEVTDGAVPLPQDSLSPSRS